MLILNLILSSLILAVQLPSISGELVNLAATEIFMAKIINNTTVGIVDIFFIFVSPFVILCIKTWIKGNGYTEIVIY